jgi:hypothetical protein
MAEIKTFIEPRYLYRYRSLATQRKFDRELKALDEPHLWFSGFDEMNDPMEGLFSASPRASIHALYRTTRRDILDRTSSLGICSFSETNFHEIMWAHYADQFRGICVEYQVSKLLKELDQNVHLVRMVYSELEPTMFQQAIGDKAFAEKVLSSKNYRWAYEQEWRALSNSKGRVDIKESCIHSVYLGIGIEDDHKNRIVQLLQEKPIECLTMVIDGYRLSFEKT